MPNKISSKHYFAITRAKSPLKYHQDEFKTQHCVQNVNVQINLPEKEDAVTGVFKAIVKLFKKSG